MALCPDHGLTDAGVLALAEVSEGEPVAIGEAGAEEAGALVAGWRTRVDAPLLDRLPDLEYVGLRATSLVRVDLEEARSRSVEVRNIVGYGDQATAEFVLAELIRARREGSAERGPGSPRELAGARLGLVGLGAVGLRVARAAAALEADVSYHRPSGERPGAPGRWVPLERLLAESEIVSFHSPPLTKVLGPDGFERLRPDADLVVTTLGLPFEVGDLAAWCAGGPRRAVLDLVAAQDDRAELERLPGVTVRPQYAARTSESARRADEQVVGRMRDYLEGRP